MNFNKRQKSARLLRCLPPLTLAVALPVHAQVVAPDAGRVLQENKPAPALPAPAPSIDVQPAPTPQTAPGGVQAKLQSVVFGGNTKIASEVLARVVGDVAGKSYDLAGLRALAERVTTYYREHGYPFARAYLPQQDLGSGVLRIEVIEGRYGTVKAIGDDKLAAQAQPFLDRLHPGEVIESAPLERAALILNDQPGIRAVPVVRPGQAQGTGDLDVRVAPAQRFGGRVSLDNFGNRYTGTYHLGADLYYNSPFMLGDQFTLSGVYTDQRMWYGTAGYNLPLGTSGLRGQVSYAHTYYRLGKDFSSLDATGTADVTSAGLSYPLIRSQAANLTLAGAYQHKELNDRQGAVSSDTTKYSDSVPVTLSFDWRDSLLGPAVTYGSLSFTAGRLHLDGTLLATDQTTARTAGSFNKLTLDIARLQALPANFSLFVRGAAQWTDKNLDSSERFGLGGATGVRAYPSGEGYGARGWLGQAELRYAIGAFAPYVFYDAGYVQINAHTWTTGSNSRNIAGPGVGLRYAQARWNAGVSVAWRSQGGAAQSDTQDKNPRVFGSVAYSF